MPYIAQLWRTQATQDRISIIDAHTLPLKPLEDAMSEQAKRYDKRAAKRSVNVSVNSDLVDKAKSLGINLSQALETRLIELIREKEKENWVRENADAIDEYNARVEENGVFSDGQRKF